MKTNYSMEMMNWVQSLSPIQKVALIILLSSFISFLLFALVACIRSSFNLELLGKKEVLEDKKNDLSNLYDGTQKLPRIRIFTAMLYANLSYHTFWNAIILQKFRSPYNNRINTFVSFPMTTMSDADVVSQIATLGLVWEYPIFLVIMSLRLIFYKGQLY